MGKKSMGTFLTDLRKEKGLTQQEVADSLNVSNKTISKWERDEGFPEITMLPAIAKYYDITIDELLDGERKSKIQNSPESEMNSSKNDNLIIERIKSVLLVSDTISVFSFILYFIFAQLIDWSGSVFIVYGLIGCTIISFLMFVINLYVFLKYKKKEIIEKTNIVFTVKSICFSLFFFVLNIFSSIIEYLNIGFGPHTIFYLIAPIAILLSIMVTYIVFSKLSKKYDLFDFSIRIKHLKKKMTVITTVICVISLAIGTVLGVNDALSMETYTTTKAFIGDDGGYLTSEDGISDYYKVKNFIVNGEKLYLLNEEEDKGILVTEFDYSFQNTEQGYKVTYKGNYEMEYIPFETFEEKAEFLDKYVIGVGESSFMDSMDENIRFNDRSYTITYKNVINYVELVIGDCTFYICPISMGLIPFIGLMALIYHKKKIKL